MFIYTRLANENIGNDVVIAHLYLPCTAKCTRKCIIVKYVLINKLEMCALNTSLMNIGHAKYILFFHQTFQIFHECDHFCHGFRKSIVI